MHSHNQLDSIHLSLVSDLEREGIAPSDLTLEMVATRLKERGHGEAEIRSLQDRIFGFGPLQSLFNDSTITEIMVNGVESVFIERAGSLEKAPVIFSSAAEILYIINRIVASVNRRIDQSSPLVDARLPDGARVHAVIPPLSRSGPVLTIRRFPPEIFSLEKLVGLETLTPAMAGFLQACILARQNILISGAAGSGKTTLLNALASGVPESERLIVIEDTAEIRLRHHHLVTLEARPPNLEGEGEITIRALLKNSLRMRPDRIIIGEVRGAEALDMLQAMNTGHPGSFTTIHANSPDDALLRLETMSLMADVPITLSAVRAQMAAAIHFVIQTERLVGGQRKVVAISEMVGEGAADSVQTMRPLFFYDKICKRFDSAQVLPDRLRQFAEAGIEVRSEWFV